MGDRRFARYPFSAGNSAEPRERAQDRPRIPSCERVVELRSPPSFVETTSTLKLLDDILEFSDTPFEIQNAVFEIIHPRSAGRGNRIDGRR